MHAQSLSHVQLFVTPWTVAHQAPLSMGLSRQEYWSGLPFPPPGNLPDPGIKPLSLTLLDWQGGSLPLVPPGKSSNVKSKPKKALQEAQETQVRSLGQEDPLEEEMATHSSILA